MKRVLNIICLASILTSAAALSASASAESWFIRFRGGSGANSVGTIPGGTISGIRDNQNQALARTMTVAGVEDGGARDSQDGGVAPPAVAPGVKASWYRPEWTKGDATDDLAQPWAFNNDVKKPLATSANLVKTWADLIVFATPGYSANSIWLYIDAGTSTNTPPTSINGQPVVYKLVMTWAPEGYAGPTEWILPTAPNGGLIAAIELPSAGAISGTPITGSGPLTATQVAGYRFSLVTPEPGTMLALGAGLASMAGMIRRRKS